MVDNGNGKSGGNGNGKDQFDKLVDAGVIADPADFSEEDRKAINEELNDDAVDALIRVKGRIHGPGTQKSSLTGAPGDHAKFIAF